ncbi:MAG: SDR family oxidoreductase, partial [Pirellulales bacterium]
MTGASRGAGRGIALVLGQAGATVYVTGRSTRAEGATGNRRETIDETAELVAARGGRAIPVGCDHTVDSDVEALFDRVRREQGRLDLLVNNAWGGYERAVDFSPFWQIPLVHWSLMFDAGVRSHLVAARCAVPLLLAQGRGLIVATTAAVGTQYRGNLFYDVAKTATNRMAVAMAEDLRPHGVAIVAFSPGWMRTEKVLDAFKTDAANWYAIAPLEKTESTEYVGRAVVTLAADPHVMQKTGRLLEVADLARQYGFVDIDGRQVPPFASCSLSCSKNSGGIN